MSNRSTLSTSEDEYVRLKLELAAKRASVDTVRLQARQLISKRDGLREDAAKNRAESEEQQQILNQTKESNEKLKIQIKEAEEERDRLIKEIEKKEKYYLSYYNSYEIERAEIECRLPK